MVENTLERVRACKTLAELLPSGIVTAHWLKTTDIQRPQSSDPPHSSSASYQRRERFAAGRLCARRAAAELKMAHAADAAIGVNPDGSANWDECLTGSITHTRGLSAAAVGQRCKFRAIGIDAERVDNMAGDLWSHLFQPAEIEWLQYLPAPARMSAATLVFSAKETFYKCQHTVTGQWLEFKDVSVEVLDWRKDRGNFAVRPTGCRNDSDHAHSPAVGRFAFTRIPASGDAGPLVMTAMAWPC